MEDKITLRPATEADAPFVAMVISEALDDDIMELYEQSGNRIPESRRERMDFIETVVNNSDNLYTWHHATMAVNAEGVAVGALLAYPGDDYTRRREVSFRLFASFIKNSFDPDKMDAETKPGEYYLDSLAVLPSYRGRGIGRMLLQAGIDKANSLGRPAILACAPENLGAKHLYESMGFKETYIYSLFGHPYHRMLRP